MSNIGHPGRVTQNRVVALLRDELCYRYLGDRQDRDGNSNIEEKPLSGVKPIARQARRLGLLTLISFNSALRCEVTRHIHNRIGGELSQHLEGPIRRTQGHEVMPVVAKGRWRRIIRRRYQWGRRQIAGE
jgi:hypothetical protein